jgi:hypothetical protein
MESSTPQWMKEGLVVPMMLEMLEEEREME